MDYYFDNAFKTILFSFYLFIEEYVDIHIE